MPFRYRVAGAAAVIHAPFGMQMKFPSSALTLASRVELLILDVDGVLTDGRLFFTTGGEEIKAFSSQDGASIKLLLATGVAVAIVTGRRSEIVARRAAELGIVHLIQGANDKAKAFDALESATGIGASCAAHVGDDLPDLGLFRRVGMKISVPGAHPVALERADYVTDALPGTGAVREVCQLIMTARGTWDEVLADLER